MSAAPEQMASAEPRSVAELIELSRQHPMKWFVPTVVLENGIHVLHGSEECFKTMFTLQLLEALATGRDFLCFPLNGIMRTGIAELEAKDKVFGHRLEKFFSAGAPDIRVLPEKLRRDVLAGRAPKDRVKTLVNWAEYEGLEFISIDSAVKLFPPGCDLSRPDLASEVFNQLQLLPSPWIIAHDRKALSGAPAKTGNAEIVGSGRFAQDPDVVHELYRADHRAPQATFSCGKMRDGEKPCPVDLYFDSHDFRLYPLHPYIHLLRQGPKCGSELIAEARTRYGWRERAARERLASLSRLVDVNGNPCIGETMQVHSKRYVLTTEPVRLLEDVGDLVQPCINTDGL